MRFECRLVPINFKNPDELRIDDIDRKRVRNNARLIAGTSYQIFDDRPERFEFRRGHAERETDDNHLLTCVKTVPSGRKTAGNANNLGLVFKPRASQSTGDPSIKLALPLRGPRKVAVGALKP
jgi:hypothetical protein